MGAPILDADYIYIYMSPSYKWMDILEITTLASMTLIILFPEMLRFSK